MPATRTAALAFLAALVIGVVALQACHAWARDQAAAPPVHSEPASSPPAPVSALSPLPADATADRLEAARMLRLFCRFVDSRRLARAGSLLAPRVWPRRELRAFTSFRFISARVYAAPDSRTIVMLTRIAVRACGPSPLPNGVATLFFTLGRVGTISGGWLITAVRSSP